MGKNCFRTVVRVKDDFDIKIDVHFVVIR